MVYEDLCKRIREGEEKHAEATIAHVDNESDASLVAARKVLVEQTAAQHAKAVLDNVSVVSNTARSCIEWAPGYVMPGHVQVIWDEVSAHTRRHKWGGRLATRPDAHPMVCLLVCLSV